MPDIVFPPALNGFFLCPNCFHPLDDLTCQTCYSEYFQFDGIPCLMPAGIQQKQAWQHQSAILNSQAEQSVANIRSTLERYDLLNATRSRLEAAAVTAQQSNNDVLELLSGAGLEPKSSPEFNNVPLGSLAEYYHHILQDWAWNPDINQCKLEHALDVFPNSATETMLVLGAGAGRLSWDLHNALNATRTIATDINPLLLLAANKLIKKREPFKFFELNRFPQIHCAHSAGYNLSPPPDLQGRAESWFPLAADVWRMPLKPQSVDLIVTSWFIDVHGGDNRDLIGLLSQWLKPGGYWLNTGPLLYPNHTPIDCKYDREEVLELSELAGFTLIKEQLTEQVHLDSPINVRTQTEQVWNFCQLLVGKSAAAISSATNDGQNNAPPAWLVLHHLAVPDIFDIADDAHPLVKQIAGLIDGHASMHEICHRAAKYLPEHVDAREAVTALLGELWEDLNQS